MGTKFNNKFDLRNHAIEQYLSRKKTGLSAYETRLFLNRQINNQVYKLKTRTRSGEDQWHVPTAKCILISKYENGTNVVVTIINDDRLVFETSTQDVTLLDNLSYLDTFSTITDELKYLVKNNQTQIYEKISSRTKLHKVILNNRSIIFTYNTNSKNIDIVSNEPV